MQFKIIVCGLDSIEARRWINSTLVGMVDFEDPESLKPLIDGGTEGMFAHSRRLQNKAQLTGNRIQGTGACDFAHAFLLYRVSA